MEPGFQPLDPTRSDKTDENKPAQKRRQIPYRLIAPNLITLLALCAGLTAIRMAIEGRMELAVFLIIIAAALDALDGRVARLFNASSRFGAELDSLTDFINFGVAPAILLFMWGLQDFRSIGWIASLLFAICTALRLARFNAALDAPNKPAWQARFFTGVPAPAGALVGMLPIYVSFLGYPANDFTQLPVVGYVLVIALLMVSNFPTYSGKTLGPGVRVDRVVPILVIVIALVALLVTYPWRFMIVGSILYLLAIPFSMRAWHKLEKKRGATSES